MQDRNILSPGTILRDIYLVEKHISSGGFGNTYKAKNTMFNETVAIKEFFMADIATRDENGNIYVPLENNHDLFYSQMEKFKKEAQRIRKYTNPHIVRVHDIFPANGTIYYVMDFIEGESLADKLAKQGCPMREDEVKALLPQVLDALQTIHNDGLWHLDIKPDNLMVDASGTVRLIDFGASKQDLSLGGSTMASAVAYTERYAPMEQVEQNVEKFGPWTDFYALGATLLNLLTNSKPPKPTDILDDPTPDKHITIQIPKTVSDTTRRLISWMMQTPRGARPQSVEQIRAFLNGSNGGNITNADNNKLDDAKGKTVVNPKQETKPKAKPQPKVEPKPKPKPELKPKPEPKKEPKIKQPEPPVIITPLDEPQKKSKTPIYVAAAALAVCLIGWGAYSMMGNEPNDASNEIGETMFPVEEIVETEAQNVTTDAEQQKETALPAAVEKNVDATDNKTNKDNTQEESYKTNLAAAKRAYSNGQYDAALSYLNRVPAQYANAGDVKNLRAQAQSAKQKQQDESKKQQEESKKQDQKKQQEQQTANRCQSLMSQANSAFKNGHYDQAMGYLNQISSISPDYAMRSDVKNLRSCITKAKQQLNAYE